MNYKRRGFTLTETVVAVIILTTAIAVSTQILVATSVQHKAMQCERVALIEAGNVIERLAVVPWSKLEAGELSDWKLSPQASEVLPDGKLEIQIEPTDAKKTGKEQVGKEQIAKELAGRRLTVTVSYSPAENQPDRSVRLVTWRYDHATAAPQPEAK